MAVRTILRLPTLVEKVGKSASTIYEEIASGTFPKPIKIGRQSVGWLEDEVEAWQQALIAERDGNACRRRGLE